MPSALPGSSTSFAPSRRAETTILAFLLVLGTLLLLYKFPSVPVGLHQDEISEAYESYSLLHTGADRWGYHLPVYFVGWGSGQNVLQAYLSIPVVAALGLTPVSARLIPLLAGLLTLPLFFFTLRRWFGSATALIGLFFLATSPWHIMFSRWGVENSPLPFFMLLGVFTFGRALDSHSRWQILPSLLPFALALYTYGVVVLILPVLLPLVFLIDPAAIRRELRSWCGAVAIFGVAALPIFFFTWKNYVTKTNYGFERWLPFSVPLLPVSRLDQIKTENAGQSRLEHNLHFLRNGFSDQYVHNQVGNISPIPTVVLVLACLGIVYLAARGIRERRMNEPFLAWFLACVPLFFLMPVDMSRGCALYVPLIALGAVGAGWLLESNPLRPVSTVLAAGCLLLLALPTARFSRRYYGPAFAAQIAPTFHPDLPAALTKTLKLAGGSMPVYVSESIQLNYVDVLFLRKTDPRLFQQSGATWNHPDFGRYRFDRKALATTPKPYAFLLVQTEPRVCDSADPVETEGQFLVGVCR